MLPRRWMFTIHTRAIVPDLSGRAGDWSAIALGGLRGKLIAGQTTVIIVAATVADRRQGKFRVPPQTRGGILFL